MLKMSHCPSGPWNGNEKPEWTPIEREFSITSRSAFASATVSVTSVQRRRPRVEGKRASMGSQFSKSMSAVSLDVAGWHAQPGQLQAAVREHAAEDDVRVAFLGHGALMQRAKLLDRLAALSLLDKGIDGTHENPRVLSEFSHRLEVRTSTPTSMRHRRLAAQHDSPILRRCAL